MLFKYFFFENKSRGQIQCQQSSETGECRYNDFAWSEVENKATSMLVNVL